MTPSTFTIDKETRDLVSARAKKDPTIRLYKLVNDTTNTDYWPFDTVDDALGFLNRDLWK